MPTTFFTCSICGRSYPSTEQEHDQHICSLECERKELSIRKAHYKYWESLLNISLVEEWKHQLREKIAKLEAEITELDSHVPLAPERATDALLSVQQQEYRVHMLELDQRIKTRELNEAREARANKSSRKETTDNTKKKGPKPLISPELAQQLKALGIEVNTSTPPTK